MGVTRKTSSRPEMSVPPLPSYFTSVLDVPFHITCVCDIHSSNFIFVPPENRYQQAEKTEEHSCSLATQELRRTNTRAWNTFVCEA